MSDQVDALQLQQQVQQLRLQVAALEASVEQEQEINRTLRKQVADLWSIVKTMTDLEAQLDQVNALQLQQQMQELRLQVAALWDAFLGYS